MSKTLLSLLACILGASASQPRLVSYVTSWEDVPTGDSLADVTDVLLAFGVTYTEHAGNSSCAQEQCKLAASGLHNLAAGDLKTTTQYLRTASAGGGHAAGRRVLLSVGGWTMGHCKAAKYANDTACAPPPSAGAGGVSCWDYCKKDPDAFAAQAIAVAQGNGFDGIDIDFETGPDLSADEAAFLKAVVGALRSKWAGAVLSFSAMETFIESSSTAFLGLMGDVAAQLDFVSAQFYNDGPCPTQDAAAVQARYETLAAAVGGPTKAVVGLAISDVTKPACYGVATGAEACKVIAPIKAAHADFGGVALWEAAQDKLGKWMSNVSHCAGAGAPTPAPTPQMDFSCASDGENCGACAPGTRGGCKDPLSAFPGSCAPANTFTGHCIGSNVGCCDGSPTPAPAPPAPTPTPPPPTPPPA
eukprot:g7055.t1